MEEEAGAGVDPSLPCPVKTLQREAGEVVVVEVGQPWVPCQGGLRVLEVGVGVVGEVLLQVSLSSQLP